MGNQTATAFFLLEFSDLPELQILHFMIFLFIYSAALVGNFLLILIVVQNQSLHTPMYFFLFHLSLSDVCYISATVPKSMAISWTKTKLISFSGCFMQVFLVLLGAGVELTFLTVMAYDRYVAICHPLQYTMIMNWKACVEMAVVAWISSIIHAAMHTANMFRLNFCTSKIQQYFCDLSKLLMISCTDTTATVEVILVEAVVIGSFCFFGILTSYGFILCNVLKIKSSQARSKAFSTCIPHLTVFCLFLFTAIFSYLKPKSMSSVSTDLMAAVLYTILPPLLNPIIYSLKNKEIHVALQKMFKMWFGFSLMI